MLEAASGNVVAIRLHVGESVHDSLLEICRRHGVTAGFVVSGIGMLQDVSLGYFDTEAKQYSEKTFPGKHELLSLAGNISEKDGGPFPHLHVVLGHPDYSVFGGHLFAANVGLTVEVMLQVAGAPVVMRRELETQWGLPGLIVDEGP
jgi:predicted DNA-binding protein with PD1-like motif